MSLTGRSKIAGRAGLTLVEILVVSVIFSILVLALFTVFKGALDSWRKSETLLDMFQNARIADEFMCREIPAAVLYQGSNNTGFWTKFEGHDAGTGAIIETNSVGDEIFFVIPVAGNAGDQDLCEVGYWLRNDNCLMRHFEYFENTSIPVTYNFSVNNAGTTTDDVIAKNVAALQFTYYYRNAPSALPVATTASWNSSTNVLAGGTSNYNSGGNELNPDGLPDAVEVSITVQSRDGQQQRVFTDFIRLPGAR